MQIPPPPPKISSAPQLFLDESLLPKQVAKAGSYSLPHFSRPKLFGGHLAGGVSVAKQGSCLVALHSLSYTVYPDVLLQWGEKQPACLVCLLLKGLQNFPGKKVTPGAPYMQRKAHEVVILVSST